MNLAKRKNHVAMARLVSFKAELNKEGEEEKLQST
jgi:hypothetical protein